MEQEKTGYLLKAKRITSDSLLRVADHVVESLREQYVSRLLALSSEERWYSIYCGLYAEMIPTFGLCFEEENEFLSLEDRLAFTRSLLFYLDIVMTDIMPESNRQIVDRVLETRRAYEDTKPEPPTSLEGFTTYKEEIDRLRLPYDEAVRNLRDTLDRQGHRILGAIVRDFTEFIKKAESPLEVAFFYGFLAYNDIGGMGMLIERDVCDYQVGVGQYRVDFAIRPRDQRLKLAIEVDGHTFHEKTEDQAVNDRSRDRYLVSQGWTVIRFHRREIAEKLKSCVEQVCGIVKRGSEV